MKKNITKILGILIIVILQLALFSKFSILESFPNLIFIISIVLLLRDDLQDSFLVAVLGGLLLDLASPLRFGAYTILLVGILLFVYFVILKSMPVPNLFLIYLLFMGIFLFVNLVIFLIIGAVPNWQIVFDALINSLWGILIYLFLGRIIKPKEEIKMSRSHVNF